MSPKFLFFVEYTYGWGIPLSCCTRGCLLQSSAAPQGQATRASVVAGIRPLTPALLPQFPRGLRGGSASCRSPREGEPFESEIHRASNSTSRALSHPTTRQALAGEMCRLSFCTFVLSLSATFTSPTSRTQPRMKVAAGVTLQPT